MTKREKILGGAVALSVVAFGASWFWSGYQEGLSQRRAAVNAAEQELAKANMIINGGTHAMARLSEWQEKSLPPNRDLAYSHYRTWLLGIASDAGLAVEDIKVDPRTPISPAYRTIGYTIEARGQLPAIAAFLHGFYSRDLLQQITRLNLQSNDGAAELNVSMQVEAMMLPGATHTADLPAGKSDRLKLANVDDYKTSLGDRSMFTVYTPPRPPTPPRVARERPKPPEFDHARQAYVTGIVQSGERWQAWIGVRTTGEAMRLHEGDSLKVGDFEGEIKSIDRRSVVVQTADGEELRVKLGDSLRSDDAAEEGS